MNKIKFALKNIAVLAILLISFIACDKDYATVGSDIIGENDFNTRSTKEFPVIAYTNPLEPIQTNNLPVNYLGAYKDPVYGLMTGSLVSQMGSSLINPAFGSKVTIDSVVMTIPYFSTRVEVNSEGETIYKLDSVFGNGLIDLSIFENKYFLNSVNPNDDFNAPLVYYSNKTTSTSTIDPSQLEGTPIDLFENLTTPANTLTNFKPSNNEIKLKVDDEITERLAPALRVKLDTTFWHNKIIAKQGEPELSNANNFNNYFRGLYFKASAINNNGTMTLLNLGSTGANVTIYYTKDPFTEGTERVHTSYVMTFAGNKVNFLENQFGLTIPQGNAVTGDEKLYLKGAEGSIAVVDLFNSGTYEDGFSPAFMDFKNKFVETDSDGKFIKSKRLVNEANLVFYVDQSMVNGDEPQRLYLYDLKNNTPLEDYYLDLANTAVPVNSKTSHLGSLQREGGSSTGEGIKYKMRITEHINKLLMKDSTNVKLGLAVSGNVNLEGAVPQYKVLTTSLDIVKKVPVSSIVSPRGTVLYGNNTADETKKLHLEIFYTCIRTDADCEDN